MKKYIFSFVLLGICIVSMVTNWYRELSYVLLVLLLIMLLDKMGKGVVLRETIAFLYAFTCLVMPAVGYKYYSSENALSMLWVKYMPVPEHVYFSYALPAITFFCLAVLLPFSNQQASDEGEGIKKLVSRIQKILTVNKTSGLIIVSVGTAISFAIPYLPGGLQYFATLFFFSSFAGFLYLHFTASLPYKKWVMIFFVLFILYNAINGGMFTIVAYMGITIFSFLLLGKQTSLFKKAIIFLIASFLIIVLQSVKRTYRAYTWRSEYKGNKIELFANLYWNNLVKGDALIEINAMFPIYVRANQGFNVALVMRRVPMVQPFDNGNRLMTVLASAFVPRLLWPDKPEAGGKFNMKFYTGVEIKGWSTNIGPLGEAYGSFGVEGGIIYMFFLGAFIRWAYKRVFVIGNRVPLIILWIPVLFYQTTYSAETDLLQIVNSILKSAFFIWLLYKLLPRWFGIAETYMRKKPETKLSESAF